MAEFNRRKKKVCIMCTGKTVDWKDPEQLKKYINEKGKILPRRVQVTVLNIKDLSLNKLREHVQLP